MKDLSREKRIYLAIWRKVWKEQLPSLTVKMPDYNLAMSVRMSMYRTIRPYREGTLLDNELRMAADQYVLCLQKSPPAIVVTLRKTADAAEAAFADLGLDEMDLLSEEEASLLKIAESITEDLAHPEPNPFYSREE